METEVRIHPGVPSFPSLRRDEHEEGSMFGDADRVNTPFELEKAELQRRSELDEMSAGVQVLADLATGSLPSHVDVASVFGLSRADRLGRVETEFSVIEASVKRIAGSIAILERHRNEVGALIEHWVECVAREPRAEIRRYLTRCLRITLDATHDAARSFTEDEVMLKAICGMSFLECEVLSALNKTDATVGAYPTPAELQTMIGRDGEPSELVVASLQSLGAKALVDLQTSGSGLKAGSQMVARARLTGTGKRLCERLIAKDS